MILTLYYMYATFLQWWRLGSLKNKLNGTLNAQNALLVCDEKLIFDAKKSRSLENLLFRNENRFGCTIVPKQKINLSSQWVVFPKDNRYLPIYFKHNSPALQKPNIYILLQAVLDTYNQHEAEILQLENFGEFVAWKITDHFEAILRSDMDKLTKLVHCFSQTDCDINHELQLLKFETVDVEGKAKKIKYVRKFSKESTLKYSLAPIHWRKFVTDLKEVYSKIRDATNPKITIDNGTPKPEDLKIVPVSEVKPIKKDKKYIENKDKYTLEVNSSDYRRHKTSDKHKSEKEKHVKDKEYKSKDYRKHKTKDETDSTKQQKKDEKTELQLESKKERNNEVAEINDREKKLQKHTLVKQNDQNKKQEKLEDSKTERQARVNNEETEPSTSAGEKIPEKLAQENRTSSKEKKLVRSSATCDDEPIENNQVLHDEDIADDSVFSPSDSCAIDKEILKKVKPPNVLVYADSVVARDNVKEVLHNILNRERYTIYDYPISDGMTWNDTTALVVVCGSVEPKLTFNLIRFLVSGGQLLCLCSDLLYSVLYTFTTAEVREHELVRFSYGKWNNVKMMHHIFCYQASPAKKQFSKDSDTSNHSNGNGSSPVAPRTPSTVNVQHAGKDYTIQVQVLGTEETWQTPSLLLATVEGSEGRCVFSQVHLEINPSEFVDDENKFTALNESNQARIEILHDILCNQLSLDCNNEHSIPDYTPAYFLGRHDLKIALLNETHCIKDNKMKAGDTSIVFCGKDDEFDDPSSTYLPILVHSCPQNFNTVSYFETLNTKYIGRLVIYSDIMSSSHPILDHNQLTHGIAVICRQQVAGIGRSNNTWLSPPGSALFSLQLHIPLISNIGRALPIIQHIQMAAVVKALKVFTEDNNNIKIGIKWPNDLYVNGCVKIGGLIVTSITLGDYAIANIGCGVNLSNSNPTTCINDIIKDCNRKTGSSIPEITHEQYFAQVFNETENFIDRFQIGDAEYFFDYYYESWLHNDSSISVTSIDGKRQKVRVVGIDEVGFLRVRNVDGKITTVQPDRNSFDMMKGLIYPKAF
ncbi:biotin--protein ligase [Sitophilus oryzae]|uniref:Biotin--protein ligase n=1 Tax=Sitophilus oryzae TaxID=7048 RepID=A0A6J2XCQ2_SITOR|nr:biotin--protein ligase [Sitophilus oryzae]